MLTMTIALTSLSIFSIKDHAYHVCIVQFYDPKYIKFAFKICNANPCAKLSVVEKQIQCSKSKKKRKNIFWALHQLPTTVLRMK